MRLATLSTFLLCGLGGLAQQVRIVAPSPNTRVTAGKPFTATVAIAPTTSSTDILALVFGAKAVNPQAPETPDLGQTMLTTVTAPTFPTPGPVGAEQNIQLTIPPDVLNGVNTTYNLTCGEFYTLGAENTPSTFTSQVPIFVASN